MPTRNKAKIFGNPLQRPVIMVGNFVDITVFKPFFIFHFIKALLVIGKQLFDLLFKIEFIDLDEFSVFIGQKAQHFALVKNQTCPAPSGCRGDFGILKHRKLFSMVEGDVKPSLAFGFFKVLGQ